MDPSHSSLGDQTQKGCFLWHGISRARDQLLVILERALQEIAAQLRSEELGMVTDALRDAKKRFHATVSFIADTG